MDEVWPSKRSLEGMPPIERLQKRGDDNGRMNRPLSVEASGSGMSGIVSHGGDHTTDKNNHNRNGRGFLR